MSSTDSSPIPNDLAAFWMPFTANRAFKKNPRIIAIARNMHYYTPEGRATLDGTAGLWCCNAGHGRAPIVEAIQNAAATLDYAPTSSTDIRTPSGWQQKSLSLPQATSTMFSSPIPGRKLSTRR